MGPFLNRKLGNLAHHNNCFLSTVLCSVYRVHNLLSTHSDEELGWVGSDDLAFSLMLTKKLGILVTNSDLWYSELSRPIIKDGKLTKLTQFESTYFDFEKYPQIEWSKNHAFLEMWLPSLTFYNVRKARPTNIAKADEMIARMRVEEAIATEALIMSNAEEGTSTITMPEEESERILVQKKEIPFTLVEPELSISVAGEVSLEAQHAQRMLEDKEKNPEATKENKEPKPPTIAYRSDTNAEGTNERNLEGEALPFTLVEPELPLTIHGKPN